MTLFFLSLGSNINPQSNIPSAIQVLRESFTVRKISSVYETQPVGPAGKDNFWNLAVEIETNIDRASLAKRLRDIETQLGRKRKPGDKYAPRTIDIDLLPQPGYQKQAFIMLPLAESRRRHAILRQKKIFPKSPDACACRHLLLGRSPGIRIALKSRARSTRLLN